MKTHSVLLQLCSLCLLSFPMLALAGPDAVVPERYRGVFQSMEAELERYLAATAGKPAQGHPAFAASLLTANANRGLTLLDPQTAPFSELMLRRFAEMGLTAVTFDVNFPILDPDYYAFTGKGSNTLERMTAFYRGMAEAARRHGLKVIVESSQVFAVEAYSTLPVKDYYRTLTPDSLEERRRAMFKRIAESMHPDWFTVAEESDTMQAVTGLAVDNPDKQVQAVARAVRELKVSGSRHSLRSPRPSPRQGHRDR
jgi:hypothetical protein